MTRRLMIAGVAVLVAAQSAIVLDAVADQISIEQRSRLNAEIAGVPAELRTRFDELYRDWRTTWERPDIRVSSNSKAVKDSDEFRALASLGPKVGNATLLFDQSGIAASPPSRRFWSGEHAGLGRW